MRPHILFPLLTSLVLFGGLASFCINTEYSNATIGSAKSESEFESEMTGLGIESNAAPMTSDDVSVPIIEIVEPSWCTNIKIGSTIVRGTSTDNGSGIKIVEVHVDKNQYAPAVPEKSNNWSSWSIPINITDDKPHRIQARATDNSGNRNWDDITINSPLRKVNLPPDTAIINGSKDRVAFVEPTFKRAAYSPNSFYAFYDLYEAVTEEGDIITKDLDKLTAEVPQEPYREYFMNFTEHVNDFALNATVNIIRDEDVHDGQIFRADGGNAYDVLFLLHNEYVSDEEYNNFKRFVRNGGTIVFLDGNMFYGQVKYDPRNCTITLVKGHDWEVDARSATKSDHEAYFDDKKTWVGSNFLYGDIKEPVRFIDNPFNYTRFEENYVSNPNATILYDYGAQIPESVLNDNKAETYPKIATYELNYGKGKVITLGLFAENLAGNEKFMEFFDRIILPRALGQSFRYGPGDENQTTAYWRTTHGSLSGITFDNQSNAVMLNLERSKQTNDTLFITLPKELTGGVDPKVREFNVKIDEIESDYYQIPNDVENGFEIPLSPNSTKVQISVIANIADSDLSEDTTLPKVDTNGSLAGGANLSSISSFEKNPVVRIVEGAYSGTTSERFSPSTINISPGADVTWQNEDVETHTVTSGSLESGSATGKLFDSGYLAPGSTYVHVFRNKGIFDYFCILHPFMKGQLVVK